MGYVENDRHDTLQALRLLRMHGGMQRSRAVQSSRSVSLSNDAGTCEVFNQPQEPGDQKFNRARLQICSGVSSNTPNREVPLHLRQLLG